MIPALKRLATDRLLLVKLCYMLIIFTGPALVAYLSAEQAREYAAFGLSLVLFALWRVGDRAVRRKYSQVRKETIQEAIAILGASDEAMQSPPRAEQASSAQVG